MNNNQTVIPSVKAKITWMNDDTSAPKKASASITIGNSFMVNGLSIVQGQKGLFVSMPQRVSGAWWAGRWWKVSGRHCSPS